MAIKVTVLNLGHPFTDSQREQISELLACDLRFIERSFQLDMTGDLEKQVLEILQDCDIDFNKPFVLNLPGLSVGAAVVLSVVHGLCGHFPAIIKMNRGGVPPVFYVAGIISLQDIRDRARYSRGKKEPLGS